MSNFPPIKEDVWVWGSEKIIWGFDSAHKYTFKILQPKVGQAGCLSLQYHHQKSESWLVLHGMAWVLLVIDGKICTRVMKAGDIQNLPSGVWHRITAISPDLQVAEPSTPDAHAADKSIPKDVVRLHCYHGREITVPSAEIQKKLVVEAVRVSDEAMRDIEKGKEPQQYGIETLVKNGAFRLG